MAGDQRIGFLAKVFIWSSIWDEYVNWQSISGFGLARRKTGEHDSLACALRQRVANGLHSGDQRGSPTLTGAPEYPGRL